MKIDKCVIKTGEQRTTKIKIDLFHKNMTLLIVPFASHYRNVLQMIKQNCPIKTNEISFKKIQFAGRRNNDHHAGQNI